MNYPEYPHIDTLWKRDEKGKIQIGEFTCEEFQYLSGLEWIGTEKVDGTNIRICISDTLEGQEPEEVLGGRTANAQLHGNLVKWFDSTVKKQVNDYHTQFPTGAVLYGEGYGAGIQKVGKLYKSDGVGFVLFDVKVGGWWLKREDVVDIADHFELEVVPEAYRGTLHGAIAMVQQGFTSAWGNFPAEGLVMQPSIPLGKRNGGRIITKIKTVDYKE